MGKNILATRDSLPHKEANVKYIDVNFLSDDDLGRRLSPIYGRKFVTVLGTIGSLRNLMDYVSRPGYPQEFLDKTRLTASERDSIPTEHIKIANYWAVIAYGLCARIKQDRELTRQLKENEYDFTSYSQKKTSVLFGKEVSISTINPAMKYYVAIIRFISEMIKNDTFSDDNISVFVTRCKDDPALPIFDGVRMIATSTKL